MAKDVHYGLGGFKTLDLNLPNELEKRVNELETHMVTAKVNSVSTNGFVTAEILGKTPSTFGINTILASPLVSNIKTYPLKNEIILVFKSLSPQYTDTGSGGKYYYISSVNLWDEPESNPLPLPQQDITSPTQNKSYQEVEAGSTNKSEESYSGTFKPGTYFNEKGTIKSLTPFEGDVIIEGRFGNSIRFGSTDISGSLKLNSWSQGSFNKNNGDPITIIDNTLNNTSIESFSNDSSIWLTSTQKLPITGSSTNYLSYGEFAPTSLDQYVNRPQIVLNSGRLVFNSTLDHILLSSRASINLNSVSSVNVDTNNFVIQSTKVYLGDSDDSLTQPVVLGDDLVSLLTDILDDLSTLTRTLQNQVGVPVGTPLAPTSLTAQLIADKIPSYQRRVSQLLSNTTRTAI